MSNNWDISYVIDSGTDRWESRIIRADNVVIDRDVVVAYLGNSEVVMVVPVYRFIAAVRVPDSPETDDRDEEPRLIDVLAAIIEPDPCDFDHHGGCQTHGYLSLEPGETCPQQRAKDLCDEYEVAWR